MFRLRPSSKVGSSPSNPIATEGESPDCPSDATTREQRAMQQIMATIKIVGCMANTHQGKYFRINFPDGASGIYLGSSSECRSTHFAHEIVAPQLLIVSGRFGCLRANI